MVKQYKSKLNGRWKDVKSTDIIPELKKHHYRFREKPKKRLKR